jgi:hypothetical protein
MDASKCTAYYYSIENETALIYQFWLAAPLVEREVAS